MEKVLWFTVNVQSAGEHRLSAHPHAMHMRQGMDTEMIASHLMPSSFWQEQGNKL